MKNKISWKPSPAEYNPGLGVQDWLTLLQDESIFDAHSLQVMARLKDIGGTASCAELAYQYGNTANFYNNVSFSLGRRIVKKTHIPAAKDAESGNDSFWPVLYTGRKTTNSEKGAFVWRLREELLAALDRIDLNDVVLYEPDSHHKPMEKHWLLHTLTKQGMNSAGTAVGDEESWLFSNEVGAEGSDSQNFPDAKVGDLVICCESAPAEHIVALAEVSGIDPGVDLRIKKLEKFSVPLNDDEIRDISELTGSREASSVNLRGSLNLWGSLFQLSQNAYDTILDLVRKMNPVSTRIEKEPYTEADFLSDVFMEKSRYRKIVALLERKKNIILQGSPGVGKTFAAKRLAWAMMGEKDAGRVQHVQFHQNYSYEDFMIGYRPNAEGFELRSGVFYTFCQKAIDNPELDYFFIIDEINRGNISKIFGELLMLIEKDYRGQRISLAYTGKDFSVPENIYIIGMMNTADRSLAVIDYALRRRFSFVQMKPGFETSGFQEYVKSSKSAPFERVIAVITELNRAIETDTSLGEGFSIGHSYFCGQDIVDQEWLRSVIEFDIVPMLEEYWFDDPKQVEMWQERLIGALEK